MLNIHKAEDVILETLEEKTKILLREFSDKANYFFKSSNKYELEVDRKDGSRVDRLFVLKGYQTTRQDFKTTSKLVISL